ncbi:hypothetical protein [Achromobacter aloeverae]
MSLETQGLGFLRPSLAPNVFDDAPPPLSGELQGSGTARANPDANASADAGLDGIKMRPREGRHPGRADASRPATRSRSSSPTDTNLLPTGSRQGTPRAAARPGFDGDARPLLEVIIDGTPYATPLTSPLAGAPGPLGPFGPLGPQPGDCPAIRLDDPVPWNAELAHVEDDGYARPRPASVLAPHVYGASLARKNGGTETSWGSATGLSAPPASRSPRPWSVGGRPLSPIYLSGAWMGGTLTSPATAGLVGARSRPASDAASPDGWISRSATLPSRASLPSRAGFPGLRRTHIPVPLDAAPSSGRIFIQTTVFADPETLARTSDAHAGPTRSVVRLWQRIRSLPSTLQSTCREWIHRIADWLSTLR